MKLDEVDAEALEARAELRGLLHSAALALQDAAEALRTAANRAQRAQVSRVDSDVLQTFAAGCATNGSSVTRMEEQIPQPLVIATRAKRQRTGASRQCSVPGCGRHVRARGYCQTHYNQLRTTGTLRPIPPRRPKRLNAVRINGFVVSTACAEAMKRYARRRGWSVNYVLTEILEAWTRRRDAGRPFPGEP